MSPGSVRPCAIVRIAASLCGALLLNGCAHRHGEPQRSVAEAVAQSQIDALLLAAPDVAPAPLRVRVYLPPNYAVASRERYPTLYINDGQDMEAVGLQDTLAALYAKDAIQPAIVIAIDMPPDRMGAYGLSDRAHGHSVIAQTRYGPVGTTAHAYSEWVTKTLVPMIDARYRTRATPKQRAVLGWSLGALNAFNLGWQYPEVFGRVGAFSPSFWLSAESGDVDAVQRTRLAQQMVAAGSPHRRTLRQYFAVGTREEAADRDGDGVNDALDDTRDLIDGWHAGGALKTRGLRQLGFRVNLEYAVHPARSDVVLNVLEGGQHNQASWARMLPGFLRWAYGKSD
ncbi:alpha/beta hydrolase [Lysobacter tyrosinilyticus]